MHRIVFSRKSGRYKYEAELAYLASQPQTKEIVRQRVDLVYELALRDVPYFSNFCKSRESSQSSGSGYSNHFDPNQPRAPAGSPGGGQWVSGGGSLLHDAQYAPPSRTSPRITGRIGALIQGGRMAWDAYNRWAEHQESYPNDGSARAIIEFENREYRPVEGGQVLDIVGTKLLTREETRIACPRLDEVQSRVDRIDAKVRMDYPNLSAQQHGTAVHVILSNEIKAQGDPDFRAEVSILKSAAARYEASYGERGTVRIDILERADLVTACIYDLKTGKAGLSAARSIEIAGEVYKNFAIKPTRIIVTEVRPKR
jgi:hypothetical protein